MPPLVLHDADGHRNVLLEDFGHGEAVQANQQAIDTFKKAAAACLEGRGYTVK